MNTRRTRLAVVFGGRSAEHAISCVSAGSVLANLDPERFEIVPIGITLQGRWVLGEVDPEMLRIEGRELPMVSEGPASVLTGDPRRHELVEPGAEALNGVDVVFPVLHGAFGEDGTIQGLLEMAGVPYVGSGVLASAVAMDKEYAKKILATEGISVGRYVVLRRGRSTVEEEDREWLGLPVFVKPARAGSSIGISRVTEWSELDDAITLARRTDPKVLVEAAVPGREVECGVLEFPDGRVEASLPAEIRVLSKAPGAWYDFETKYLGNEAALDIPAKLDDAGTEEVRATAVRAFQALDCQGLARVDFFIGDDGAVTLNEVNTMPGFTPTSAYPKMWQASGVGYGTLLTTLVETAVARGTGLR